MHAKFLSLVLLSASALIFIGCDGDDSNTDGTQDTFVAPTAVVGQTMTMTVTGTTFLTNAILIPTNVTFSTASLLPAADTGSGTTQLRHNERPGQVYMIHFEDDRICTIHHPDTHEAAESTTYIYNKDARTIQIQGPPAEMHHLTFESPRAGKCHIEDDQGNTEDDDFTLSGG
jgi:hypothetical protein